MRSRVLARVVAAYAFQNLIRVSLTSNLLYMSRRYTVMQVVYLWDKRASVIGLNELTGARTHGCSIWDIERGLHHTYVLRCHVQPSNYDLTPSCPLIIHKTFCAGFQEHANRVLQFLKKKHIERKCQLAVWRTQSLMVKRCARSSGRDVRQGGIEKQAESTVAIGH